MACCPGNEVFEDKIVQCLRKSCALCYVFICCDFHKTQYFTSTNYVISRGGFFERFDSTDGIGGLLYRLKYISHTFPLHSLYISVCHQLTDRSAHGVSGTVIDLY